MKEIFVNLTCLMEHLSIPNTKVDPNEVCFRQVLLHSQTCIKGSPLGQRKDDLLSQCPHKIGFIRMTFFCDETRKR